MKAQDALSGCATTRRPVLQTREQVERASARSWVNITGLIDVTVSTRAGKLRVTWQRNQEQIDTATT